MVEYPHGQVRAVTHYGVAARRHRARPSGAIREALADDPVVATAAADRLIGRDRPIAATPDAGADHQEHHP